MTRSVPTRRDGLLPSYSSPRLLRQQSATQRRHPHLRAPSHSPAAHTAPTAGRCDEAGGDLGARRRHPTSDCVGRAKCVPTAIWQCAAHSAMRPRSTDCEEQVCVKVLLWRPGRRARTRPECGEERRQKNAGLSRGQGPQANVGSLKLTAPPGGCGGASPPPWPAAGAKIFELLMPYIAWGARGFYYSIVCFTCGLFEIKHHEIRGALRQSAATHVRRALSPHAHTTTPAASR